MADPTKPPNRLKPFRRINNDSFLVAKAPDGLGVACGCHTPDEIPNLEEEFKKFLDEGVLPVPLLQTLDKVTAIVNTISAAILAAVIPLAIALGLESFGLATIAAIAQAVKFVNEIASAINAGIRRFFVLIGKRLSLRAIRVVPQWVPVLRGASSERITQDQIKEIEGVVTRSYGDPIEPPFSQWHTWFNWTVHVQPDDRYLNLLSPADNPPNLDGKEAGEQALARPRSLEVQWDTGALFADRSPFEAGLKNDTDMPSVDGPMTTSSDEWIWPMTGMQVWASGRWVYDCSRTTKSTGADPQMGTMLNPPRAIATATWEAVQFAEHQTADKNKSTKVPAIRFMFFACKRGGYMSYDSLAEGDYEFILDLPPLEQQVTPFPIGATPDVPHNVIVVRPRLLKSRATLEFAGPRAKLLDPIIEEIEPSDPAAKTRQVKITIPKNQLDGADAAGVILSLGWFDPNLERAATVKACRVTFRGLSGRFKVRDNPVAQIRELFAKELDELADDIAARLANLSIFGVRLEDIVIPNPFNPSRTIGQELRDLVQRFVREAIKGLIDTLAEAIGGAISSEEWLVRVGVNGRWQSRYIPNMDKGATALSPPITFELSLGPDDLLFYSAAGVEFNPVGDMMRAAFRSRLLTLKGRPAFTWAQIVNANSTDHRNLVFQYALDVLVGNKTSANPALGVENTQLGVIDPDFSQRNRPPEKSNPLPMAGLAAQALALDFVAPFARAAGQQLVLVENPTQPDYQLTGAVQLSPQR